jgi:PKD repeat protein
MKKTFITLCFALCTFLQGNAQQTQEPCATVANLQEQQAKGLMLSDALFEQWVSRKMAETPHVHYRQTITIPVVVHIIHNETEIGKEENITESQVLSQMKVLNEDFRRKEGTPGYNTDPRGADTEIEFCLARFDQDGNPFNGIDRVKMDKDSWSRDEWENTVKPATIWNPEQYYNIWISKNFADGGGGSILLGYAQFPSASGLNGIPSSSPPNTDGIVMRADRFGSAQDNDGTFYISSSSWGRTLTHETGHWLGLRHIWGDGPCEADDYCNDTPAQESNSSGCPIGRVTCEGVNMVQNYMDYSSDQCMNIFTECQKQRMMAVLMNSPRRKELVNSTLCEGVPAIKFTASTTDACPNTLVQFNDISGLNPTSWQWTFPGGTPATSTTQNPLVVYTQSGLYDVILTASNDIGTNTDTLKNYINISTGIKEVVFEEDFESGWGGWRTINPDGRLTWDTISCEGDLTGGQLSAYMKNYQGSNAIGQRDFLISPIITAMYGRTGGVLTLDYAYRQTVNLAADSLIISISKDGGNTFQRLYANAENGDRNFVTDVLLNGNFIPTKERNWCHSSPFGPRCLEFDLSAFSNESNIVLRFENYSNNGNNVFIDNIKIEAACVAQTTAPFSRFSADRTYGCNSLDVQFADKSLANPTAWEWTFEGGTPAASTERNPSVSYAAPGTYRVTLKTTNANGAHTSSVDDYILVSAEPPLAGFTFDKQGLRVDFTNSSQDAARFVWDFGDGSVSTERNPVHYFVGDGDYTVQLTAYNGCGESLSQSSLSLTPVNDPSFVESLDLFPNPNDGSFTLRLMSKTSGKMQLVVSDLLGRTVFSGNYDLKNSQLIVPIDLGGYAQGAYVVQLRSGKQVAHRKILVY